MDCKSKYINIPCGHCPECVTAKQHNIVQRVLMENLENHIFFCTLTYNNESLPWIATSEINEKTGLPWQYRFADTRDFSLMCKRLRNNNLLGRPFRFFAVTELGSEKGRPHFHALFLIPKYEKDDYLTCLNLEDTLFKTILKEWRRNYGNSRKPDYRELCTYVRRFIRGKVKSTYDLHYVNPNLTDGSEADVAYYVSKYMVKPSEKAVKLQQALRLNLPEDEYNRVWRIVKPKWFSSPQFGLNGRYIEHNVYEPSEKVLEYLRKCIDDSKRLYDEPKFIDYLSGKSYPMSRYYMNRLDIMSVEDWKFFHDKQVRNGKRRVDNMSIDERARDTNIKMEDLWNMKMNKLNFDDELFDELL